MDTEYLVIGGGIAGASAGYFLAQHGDAILLERESQPGYHTTGRSAALFTEFYFNPVAGALTAASRSFLEGPPEGFSDVPLMTPRGTLFIARPDQMETLDRLLVEAQRLCPGAKKVSAAQAVDLCPPIVPGYLAAAIYDPDSKDMDVDAIHQGYLRGFRQAGGQVHTNAGVTEIRRVDDRWHVTTAGRTYTAEKLVNAAGAWADKVAAMAGVTPISLTSYRRTVILSPVPGGEDPSCWASVVDIGDEFYWKPDRGKLLGSPCDETPMEPQDVQPDELDVAVAVDRIERTITFRIKRVDHRWAGLRTFAADRNPVCGPDPTEPNFIWCAGQGGSGIVTSPAIGSATAAAAVGLPFPEAIETAGVTAKDLAPARFR